MPVGFGNKRIPVNVEWQKTVGYGRPTHVILKQNQNKKLEKLSPKIVLDLHPVSLLCCFGTAKPSTVIIAIKTLCYYGECFEVVLLLSLFCAAVVHCIHSGGCLWLLCAKLLQHKSFLARFSPFPPIFQKNATSVPS